MNRGKASDLIILQAHVGCAWSPLQGEVKGATVLDKNTGNELMRYTFIVDR